MSDETDLLREILLTLERIEKLLTPPPQITQTLAMYGQSDWHCGGCGSRVPAGVSHVCVRPNMTGSA